MRKFGFLVIIMALAISAFSYSPPDDISFNDNTVVYTTPDHQQADIYIVDIALEDAVINQTSTDLVVLDQDYLIVSPYMDPEVPLKYSEMELIATFNSASNYVISTGNSSNNGYNHFNQDFNHNKLFFSDYNYHLKHPYISGFHD